MGNLLDSGAPLRISGKLMESFGVLTVQAKQVGVM